MKQHISWQCARFDELFGYQIYAILKARCEVFIVEQTCAFLDIDGKDASTLHLMAWTGGEQRGQLAAYCRIHEPGSVFKEPALGRVLTTPSFRGTGIGRQLLIQGLKHIEALYPGQPVRIGAQSYLIDFYGSFGFKVDSAEYLEDDIAHVEMLRTATIKT